MLGFESNILTMKRISPIYGARVWKTSRFFEKVKRLSQSQNKFIRNKWRKVAEKQKELWSRDKSYPTNRDDTDSRLWNKNYHGNAAYDWWESITND
jgi:hypothetical protein|tara:strand:+ start:6000 stop:6287 length:288 start_codon:yes stop_codon:yes gene_type:complete